MAKTNEKTTENLPVLAQPRLPYHPAVKERFGYDKSDWKALVEAIFPVAQTPESVILALSYCKARKLDPFKRCVHIVAIWDKSKGRMVDTIWPGIGEVRTTAHRTKCYAGRDKTEVGKDMTQHWEGKTKGKKPIPFDFSVTFPEWAQVTVYRIVNNERVAYAGPQVYWIETFAENSGGAPNSIWQKRPRGQLDKCAEAAALRAAFPEEIGNDYIDAEAHVPGQSKSFEAAHAESDAQVDARTGMKHVDVKMTDTEPDTDGHASDEEFMEGANDPETKADLAAADVQGKLVCQSCGTTFDEKMEIKKGGKKWRGCPECNSKGVIGNPNYVNEDAFDEATEPE